MPWRTLISVAGPVRIADGQRALLADADAYASLIAPRPADAFDEWVLDREVQLADAAPPPQYDANGEPDYQALDDYGEWVDEPEYGRVWMPAYAYGGYDPFSYGRWQQTSFGGWSWYDPMPWGYYTSFGYGGHWTYLHHRNRWCWVPPRPGHWNGHGRDHRPPREVAHGYTAPYRSPRGSDPRRVNNGAANPEPEIPRNPSPPRAFEGTKKPAADGKVVVSKPVARELPTVVPRTTPRAAPVVNRQAVPTLSPRAPSAPAAAPRSASSGGGKATMAPAKAQSPARSQSQSSSQGKTVTSTAQKGMATRQEP